MGFYMIRPPEESRTNRELDEERKPLLFVLKALVMQTWTSILTPLTGKIKKQLDHRTAPLEVRMNEARTSKLTQSEIELLLKDPSPLVRMELVHNDTISGEVLERLKHDPDATVSMIARRKQLQFM